jgi:hypothetical protein
MLIFKPYRYAIYINFIVFDLLVDPLLLFCVMKTGGTAATFQEGEGGSKRRNSRRSQRQTKARQETKSFFGL